MSIRQLDNDNPTIFAPTAPASSSRRKSGKALLWENRAENFGSSEEDDSEEERGEQREEIDAEEVFGVSLDDHDSARG